MKIDGVRLRSRIRSAQAEGNQPDRLRDSRARSQDEQTGTGNPNIRKLINRLEQAEIDPRKRAKISGRIRSFLSEDQQGEGSGFDPRKVVDRIKNSDLSDQDKRQLVERVKSFVAEESSQSDRRRQEDSRADEGSVPRRAIDVA